jgi:hypothetical protein
MIPRDFAGANRSSRPVVSEGQTNPEKLPLIDIVRAYTIYHAPWSAFTGGSECSHEPDPLPHLSAVARSVVSQPESRPADRFGDGAARARDRVRAIQHPQPKCASARVREYPPKWARQPSCLHEYESLGFAVRSANRGATRGDSNGPEIDSRNWSGKVRECPSARVGSGWPTRADHGTTRRANGRLKRARTGQQGPFSDVCVRLASWPPFRKS